MNALRGTQKRGALSLEPFVFVVKYSSLPAYHLLYSFLQLILGLHLMPSALQTKRGFTQSGGQSKSGGEEVRSF